MAKMPIAIAPAAAKAAVHWSAKLCVSPFMSAVIAWYMIFRDERYNCYDEVHIYRDVQSSCEKFRIDGYCAGREEIAERFAAAAEFGCVEDDLAYDSADCCGYYMTKSDIELYAECY